eukprot:4230462-Pleurochrysis_carterae.AAC.1
MAASVEVRTFIVQRRAWNPNYVLLTMASSVVSFMWFLSVCQPQDHPHENIGWLQQAAFFCGHRSSEAYQGA